MLQRDEERDLIQRAQAGDQKAQDALVLSHLPMVHALRRRGYPEHIWEDIESQGVLGLIRAVHQFDLSKHDTRFSTYARWWLRETIGTYVRKNAFVVKYGTGKFARRIYSRLPKLLGGFKQGVTQRDLEDAAVELDVPLYLVEGFWQVYNSGMVPSGGDEVGGMDFLHHYDPLSEYDEKDEQRVQMRVIREALELLSPHHRLLLEKRFFSEPPATVEQVADQLGVMPGRIPAMETRAKMKLIEAARGIAELDGLSSPSVDQFVDTIA